MPISLQMDRTVCCLTSSSPVPYLFLKLTNSDQTVMIDAELYEQVSKFNWYLKKSAFCSYVCRNIRIGHRIKTVRLHRYIWELVNGSIPDGFDIHHIEANTLDCRISKLEAMEHQRHGLLQGAKNADYIPI